jgi:hypothetical protein
MPTMVSSSKKRTRKRWMHHVLMCGESMLVMRRSQVQLFTNAIVKCTR